MIKTFILIFQAYVVAVTYISNIGHWSWEWDKYVVGTRSLSWERDIMSWEWDIM